MPPALKGEPTAAQAAWGFVAVLVLAMGALAAYTAINVHSLCHGMFPPQDGMPRAGTCDTIDAGRPWLSLTLGPTLLTALVVAPLRHRPRLALAAAVLIVAALVVGMALLEGQDARSHAP
ncbi:MAG: hypothetical protein HZB46_06210 [Solirubrobacterales bacterium]|nr:hypothetical protein [Solirubrobacterales bacterium]